MEKRLFITMKDLKKYEILNLVIQKKIKGCEAAQMLGYTKIHVSRLKKKVKSKGLAGLLRTSWSSPRRIPDKARDKIASLYKSTYWDFNIMHFRDKLIEEHNINYSYETIRRILVGNNLHKPKKKKKVYRRRRRMPCAGMLIQMDSSQHNWIPEINEKWWLTANIDDATNEVLFAKLYSSDGVFNNMEVLRKAVEKKGVFAALYVDKASQFKTTRYGGVHVNISDEQKDTQIERALQELGINLILANSCQAKGRIERLFRTFQDRFVKELRLRGITDYQRANKFLIEEFLPYYNRKFAYTEGVESLYKDLPKGLSLDFIFCKKYQRHVNPDNTIKIEREIIQIPPSKYRVSFAKCIVDVCLHEDGRIYILHENHLIHATHLSKSNNCAKIETQIEKFLNKREYTKLTF